MNPSQPTKPDPCARKPSRPEPMTNYSKKPSSVDQSTSSSVEQSSDILKQVLTGMVVPPAISPVRCSTSDNQNSASSSSLIQHTVGISNQTPTPGGIPTIQEPTSHHVSDLHAAPKATPLETSSLIKHTASVYNQTPATGNISTLLEPTSQHTSDLHAAPQSPSQESAAQPEHVLPGPSSSPTSSPADESEMAQVPLFDLAEAVLESYPSNTAMGNTELTSDEELPASERTPLPALKKRKRAPMTNHCIHKYTKGEMKNKICGKPCVGDLCCKHRGGKRLLKSQPTSVEMKDQEIQCNLPVPVRNVTMCHKTVQCRFYKEKTKPPKKLTPQIFTHKSILKKFTELTMDERYRLLNSHSPREVVVTAKDGKIYLVRLPLSFPAMKPTPTQHTFLVRTVIDGQKKLVWRFAKKDH